MEIKAIETEYAGCRFRSRLEARWAVFFDRLGLEWQYEPEGFEGDRSRYLPDFLLPELRLYVEVKGVLSHRDLMKMMEALPGLRPDRDGQVCPSLLLLGPVPRPGTAWTHVEFSMLRDLILWQQVFFDDGPGSWIPKPIATAACFGRGLRDDLTEDETASFRREWLESTAESRLRLHPDIDDAYRAARSARFEFGERS